MWQHLVGLEGGEKAAGLLPVVTQQTLSPSASQPPLAPPIPAAASRLPSPLASCASSRPRRGRFLLRVCAGTGSYFSPSPSWPPRLQPMVGHSARWCTMARRRSHAPTALRPRPIRLDSPPPLLTGGGGRTIHDAGVIVLDVRVIAQEGGILAAGGAPAAELAAAPPPRSRRARAAGMSRRPPLAPHRARTSSARQGGGAWCSHRARTSQFLVILLLYRTD
nr:uncharacterized protein LOC127316141 [Lolium perenne]